MTATANRAPRVSEWPTEQPFLTATQVGKKLGGVSAQTVYQWAKVGFLPCLRVGRRLRFPKEAIERHIATAGKATEAAPTDTAAIARAVVAELAGYLWVPTEGGFVLKPREKKR